MLGKKDRGLGACQTGFYYLYGKLCMLDAVGLKALCVEQRQTLSLTEIVGHH